MLKSTVIQDLHEHFGKVTRFYCFWLTFDLPNFVDILKIMATYVDRLNTFEFIWELFGTLPNYERQNEKLKLHQVESKVLF